MDCKAKLESYLRENHVPYQTQHHDLAYTAQQVASSEHVSGRFVAKVVMVVADGKEVMLVLPASLRVDLAKLGSALGSKQVRLAYETEFQSKFPDCEVGAMPPFGDMYGVQMFVDESLTRDDHIVFQAGTHVDTFSIPYTEYARLAQPHVADITYHH
jgi:Ala-tRNA(Pro) deacylase